MIERYEYQRIVTDDEIDQLGHANNLVYLQWAVRAAVEHSNQNGWDYDRYRQLGAGWVVRTHTITYLRPAFLGDTIVVRTWIAEIARATCRRVYQIDRQKGESVERLAEAATDWVFVDFERMVPKRIPPEVAGSFLVIPEEEG